MWILIVALILVFAMLVVVATFWAEIIVLNHRHAAPMLPSSRKLRDAVIREINAQPKNLRTVLDIGSGYGGLARRIARDCPAKNVTAVEKMPTAAILSKICDIFSRSKSRTIWGDAFEFIEQSDGFDIGMAYLLTPMMPRLEKLRGKFKVLLILDFPLPNIKFSRKIKLHKDWSQHFLYIYE